MNAQLKRFLVRLIPLMFGLLLMWLLAFLMQPGAVSAQESCQQLESPKQIKSPVLINFDSLPNAKVIADSYRPSYGVRFEDNKATRALIYGNEPAKAKSSPNVASNDAVSPGNSSGVPMRILFDNPKSDVGFWIGNGETAQLIALVSAFDEKGNLVCQTRVTDVPEAHTRFVGFSTGQLNISRVELDYGQTAISESIDDLYFAPAPGYRPAVTRTPVPAWTPIPSATPLPGRPAPTATSLVPMLPLQPYLELERPIIQAIKPDFAIHGIEITQGIQCFDTSKGLTGCADNSLPVVAKKDSFARIYLKANGVQSIQNNIPVRLHIRANGIWYTANSTGNTTTAIDQAASDSANIYFNVNFTNSVVVDFYAVVDPNNIYSESNESNNRFPAGTGYITKTFTKRDTMKIVGQRLRYHPSGYTGTQYAGGWAVNGGAADWFEQMLPMRNNSINYSIKSGYLDWTTSLGSGTGQHALIQTLNTQWMLENLFWFWFSGPFTGARHVYGWAPSAGYSGGHADMPVYPHAGGLGVVGIGSDAPGTSTDNPGSGALIFGHELVHDYDVLHTNTSDGCGSNDSASDFPYTSSSIQEFGFNPFTGKIYNPSNTHDLMSYCPAGGSREGWISPFTWTRMFNKFTVSSVTSLAADEIPQPLMLYQAAAVEKESLQINATVFNPAFKPDVPAKFGKLYKTGGGSTYLLPAGPYVVELRGAGGVLAKYTFGVNFESEYDAHSANEQPSASLLANDPPPFPPDPTPQVDVSFIVPWEPGTVAIALVFNDQVLDLVSVSPNAPQVLITAPTGVEAWAAGSQHVLTWQGLDLDGGTLSYTVFYSYDGGATWSLLASELTANSYAVNADDLAGGSDVRFRVIVTDGVHTAFDETDHAISVPNKAPVATVLNPTTNGFYQFGALVVLQGIAIDLEDGTLPDEALVWTSSLDGQLGIGPSVPLNTLSRGTHTITLTATDKNGVSSVSTLTILIGNRLYLPITHR